MGPKIRGNKLQCHFRNEYKSDFPWVESVLNDPKIVKCQLCNDTFSLSNMGRQSLISHSKSKKHQESIKIRISTIPIEHASKDSMDVRDVTNIQKGSSQYESSVIDNEGQNLAMTKRSQTSQLVDRSQNLNHNIDSNIHKCTVKVSAITNYLTKEDVSKAEILWVMHNVSRDKSLRDIESSLPILKKMFSDSDIAKKLQISKSKASCMITYGLKNYF